MTAAEFAALERTRWKYFAGLYSTSARAWRRDPANGTAWLRMLAARDRLKERA